MFIASLSKEVVSIIPGWQLPNFNSFMTEAVKELKCNFTFNSYKVVNSFPFSIKTIPLLYQAKQVFIAQIRILWHWLILRCFGL